MRQLEQELTAHATALRALARVLVGEQQADDLVQDTVLQVLANPPPRPTGLRGWLMSVLRHRASKLRRGERRRQQRERASVPPDAEATPARVAEHRETLQRLTAALTALPEPYLGTLVLRFFEGLLPGAIAARTGVPLPTVKSRLQRGLVLLREGLASSDPDWRSALGGVFGTGAMQVAVLTTGVMVMGSATKVAVGAAVIAVAALLWLTIGTSAGAPGDAGSVAAGSGAVVGRRDRTAAAGNAEAGQSTGMTRTQADGAAAHAVIRGRIVDESGRPLRDCTVTLRAHRVMGGSWDHVREYADWLRMREHVREQVEWLRAHGGDDGRQRQVVTGDDGLFEFAVERSPLSLYLALRRDRVEGSFGVERMLEAATQDLGDVVLPCTCIVRVRIVDRNGSVPATPPLRISEGLGGPDRGPRFYGSDGLVRSEGDGVFIWALVAGNYRCTTGHKIERGEELVVPPGLTACEHEIVVEPLSNEVIAGSVVDERHLPVTGVSVTAWTGPAYAVARTDPGGRFTLYRPEGAGQETQLSLDHDDYEPLSVKTPARFGGPEVRLVLRDLPAVVVHAVADADGKAVEDFLVRCWWDARAEPDSYKNEGGERADGHHPGGLATLTSIERGDHLLVVEPLRWDLWRSAPQFVQVTMPGPTRVEVRLGVAADRLLRVLGADGTPLPRAEVAVVEDDAGIGPGTRLATLERWSPSRFGQPESVALVQETRTDARGEALLHGPADRALTLRISQQGSRQHFVTPVSLREPETLVVTMPVPASLVVHVRPPAMVKELRSACGLPEAGPAPRDGSRHQPGFRLVRGPFSGREMVPASEQPAALIAGDGTVQFADVPAGEWQLGLDSFDAIGGKVQSWQYPVMLRRVSLPAGARTELDLDLGDWLPGEIEGTVSLDGELVADAAIAIEVERASIEFPWPQRWLLNAKTDAQGRFRLRTRQGSLRVAIDRSAQYLDLTARITSHQLVYADRQVWLPGGGRLVETFAIAAVTARIRLLDNRGEPVSGVPLVLVGPTTGLQHRTMYSNAEGRIRCELEPLTFTAQVLPQKLQTSAAQMQYLRDHPGQRDALGAARLSLGQFTATKDAPEVELRLPDEWQR